MNGLSFQALVRRVDLFTLKLFLSAVEEGQIGRAAAREHIAPSAATKRIQDLEDLAGLKLFERNPKGVVPSPAGEVLARHIRMMLNNLEAMRREIGEFAEGVRGHIGVCAPRLLIVHFLAREVAEFLQSYPQAQVDLREDNNAGAVRALNLGEVDLAVFVASPDLPTEGIESFECGRDRLVAVVPRGHYWCGREELTLEELLEADIVSPAGTTLLPNLRRAAAALGREVHSKFNVNTVEAARSMVAAGLGVTIQPESMLSPEDHGQMGTGPVCSVPLDGEWAMRSHRVGMLRGKSLGPACMAFIHQLTGHHKAAAQA
ncbi:LysR family transcriptional regulator [Cupriavidus sp. H39]|uniref:LysR family transcriptional regulator n=1 Tax=Cupriavidus sp. H39 TaxID=3401635 RepID=UPI003D068D35